MVNKVGKLYVCVLCDKTWYGLGNNPAPLKKRGLCCNKCNLERVLPARLNLMKKAKK